MIKYNIKECSTSIKTKIAPEGEHIETVVNRIMTNKEPIKDGAPIIYMDRKDGVAPQYDVRTDRMEVALEAQDSIKRNLYAKRDAALKAEKDATLNTKEDSKKEHGTEQSQETA